MDLSTIEMKLIDRDYKLLSEFQEDITLMFNNCRLYNGASSGKSSIISSFRLIVQK